MLIILFLILQDRPAVSFCAVGDVMLDRGIRRTIIKNGVDYPFENVGDFINQFDLAFCNLECSISNRGASTGKIYSFRADTTYFEIVKSAGFDVLCLANNHVIDWGKNAFTDTKEIIERNGLYAVGAGENQEQARKPAIIEKNGLRFAFLGSVGMPLKGVIWPLDKPGPCQATLAEILSEIKKVRPRVDFVIVSLHWGNEFQHKAMTSQVEWAHRIIDAGADLIIGHHPHVLQPIEIYKNRIILYSLGNFLFDQHKLYQRQSGIFSCTFRKGAIDSATFYPVVLNNFRPEIAEQNDYELIVEKIKNMSSKVLFTSIGNQILLSDSKSIHCFKTPLKYASLNNKMVCGYSDRIEVLDTAGVIINRLDIHPPEEIRNCHFIEGSLGLHLFAIIGQPENQKDDYQAQYSITERAIVYQGNKNSNN